MSDSSIDRAAKPPPGVARKIRGFSDKAIAWFFIGPTIFLLLAINIFPLIWTINLSDSDIWLTMQATAHFVIWTIVLQVLIGFTLAWLINNKFKGNDLWTTIIVLPMMLSPAVVGNFWTFLYQPQIGLFNDVTTFFTGGD